MLGLLLEAVAGEMPAGSGEEPPEACPRCGYPRTVKKGRDADGARRRLCRGCGVSLKTSFSMRHRLCEVMSSKHTISRPSCPVEADETLVPDSLSGNHSRSAGFPCPAPHAGVLAGMGVAAHERFASSGPRAPFNRVNALHSALKAFLVRFSGSGACRPGACRTTSRGSAGRARRAGAVAPGRCCGADGVGAYRTSWRGALAPSVPVPSGARDVVGGLTQPSAKSRVHGHCAVSAALCWTGCYGC